MSGDILNGALIDDCPIWTNVVKTYFSKNHKDVALKSYKNYTLFQNDLKNGTSFDFTIGDFHIIQDKQIGAKQLGLLYGRYSNNMGDIYLQTSLTEVEFQNACEELNIKIIDPIKHVSKTNAGFESIKLNALKN